MQTAAIFVPPIALAVTTFAALLGYQYVSQRMRINHLISDTLKFTREIVSEDTIPSNKANLAHEVVKKLCGEIPEHNNSRFFKIDLGKIRHALEAARFYYWVRTLEGATRTELKEILRNREHRIKRRGVRSSSLDYVLHTVLSSTEAGIEISSLELLELKMQCESDIAELEKHRISINLSTKWKRRS